jgi:hypothetical protein
MSVILACSPGSGDASPPGTRIRPVRVFEANEIVGESARAAYLDAEAWLVTAHGE